MKEYNEGRNSVAHSSKRDQMGKHAYINGINNKKKKQTKKKQKKTKQIKLIYE